MNLMEQVSGCTVLADKRRYVEAIRPDGLKVFFDKADDPISQWLNTIRANADRRSVYLAIGIGRGLQIAQNYAETHGDDADRCFIANEIAAYINAPMLISAEKI